MDIVELLYILLVFCCWEGICQVEIKTIILNKPQCASGENGCIAIQFTSVDDLADKLQNDENLKNQIESLIEGKMLNEAAKSTPTEKNSTQLLAYVKEKMTYDQAKKYCHNISANLASSSIRDKSFLVKNPKKNLWIGLEELDGFWRWSDGLNSTENNTDWDIHQPGTNDEKCGVSIHARNWTIHDYPCSRKFSFICEQKEQMSNCDD